jgi:putative ABC transport system permease protein
MVIRLVLTEAFFIGLLGTAAGLAVGLGFAIYYGQVGIDLSSLLEGMNVPIDPVIYTVATPMTGIKMALFGILVALAAAWYPARVAVRREPAQAIATRR